MSTKNKSISKSKKDNNGDKEVDCELSNSIKAGDLLIYDPSDEVSLCEKELFEKFLFVVALLEMEKVPGHIDQSQAELYLTKRRRRRRE